MKISNQDEPTQIHTIMRRKSQEQKENFMWPTRWMKSLKIPTTQHRQGTHHSLRVLFFVIKGGNSISDPDIVLFKQS